VGGDEIKVSMWREGREEDENHVVRLTCFDQGNGVYDTHVRVIHGDLRCLYILAVTVNGADVCYSPFSFNACDDNLLATTPADISEIEELKRVEAEAKKTKKEKKKLAKIEQENLEKFEVLRRREMTNRRAVEALRKEKSRRSRENEERRMNRLSKRTGGGFIVQFSKEV
jgi:hypothetical protein